jgi:hypothetical protein
MNGQVKKDIHCLIGRQASFNDEDLSKRRIITWEIKELDFLSPDDYTLHDYIMSIRHPTEPKKSLFHSVDHLCFNHSTVVFTCMPSMEAEAWNMVSNTSRWNKRYHWTLPFERTSQLRNGNKVGAKQRNGCHRLRIFCTSATSRRVVRMMSLSISRPQWRKSPSSAAMFLNGGSKQWTACS